MRISMIPSNDVKTIHASQNDTQREWSFEPFDNNGTLIIGEESLANITRVKGNTLAFNQLLQNGNFASTSKWYTQQGATQSVSNNVITLTCSTDNGHTVNTFNSIPAGHKCLISCECKTASANARAIMAYCGNYTDSSAQITLRSSSTNWERLTGVVTSATGNVFQFRLYADSATNQFRNAMLIDLTQMFGAGKEPTVEQFKALFPLLYYSSNQGTLLPFKGTSIKTVGKNLFTHSVSSLTTNGITFTPQNDGSVKVSGTATGNAYYNMYNWETNSFLPVNESLKLSGGTDQVRFTVAYRNTDGSGTVEAHDTGNGATITIPSADKVIYSALRVLQGITIDTVIYPMVTFANAEQTYEPYTSSITNLPTLTYFPNGMKSAGNVYDELLPTKAITRVGMVDLGTLNWYYNTDALSFSTTLPDVNRNNNNIICSKYAKTNLWQVDKTCRLLTNGNLVIFDSTYTDATAFKTAMNGVYLYYELKNYVETDADADVFYPVYQYGTEQILPINGANPTTSPFNGDIYYADGLKTDQTFFYRQTPINYNTRQFALVSKNTETPLTLKDGKGYCNSPLALTNESGFFDAKLKMTDSDGVCYSEKFQIHVERRP